MALQSNMVPRIWRFTGDVQIRKLLAELSQKFDLPLPSRPINRSPKPTLSDDRGRITAPEAAALLGISISRLAHWRMEGKGPKSQPTYPGSRSIRYIRAEVVEWIMNNQPE